jgi:RNA polymerase sigma-70 factor (ECF subfamily)
MTDWTLWYRACQGHKPSATALVHSLTPQAHALAMQLLRKTEDAQDVVQESFLRLWSSQPTEGVGAKLSTFFNTIVINRCKTHLTRKHELSTGHDALMDLADAHQHITQTTASDDMAFSAAQLQQALGTLPARQRMALAMWAYADAQAGDIAQALEIEINAAHQLLFRAKATLRNALHGARL